MAVSVLGFHSKAGGGSCYVSVMQESMIRIPVSTVDFGKVGLQAGGLFAIPACCGCTLWDTAGDGSSIWVSAIHAGRWLWPGHGPTV